MGKKGKGFVAQKPTKGTKTSIRARSQRGGDTSRGTKHELLFTEANEGDEAIPPGRPVEARKDSGHLRSLRCLL